MKAKIWIVLIIILLLGVTGCMSNDPKDFSGVSDLIGPFERMSLKTVEQDTLAYLSEKYGETFAADQVTREFDGVRGTFYRVVFHSESRPEKGVLYCCSQGTGTALAIDGVDCVVSDDYRNVIIQARYAADIQAELGDAVLVKCRVKTPGGTISDADLAAGVQTSLENAETEPHVYIVVLADASARSSDLKEKAEAFVGKLNVYRQYLYIGYQTDLDLNNWELLYRDNSTEFERYLVDESAAEYVEFSAFYLDEGLKKRSVVKE